MPTPEGKPSAEDKLEPRDEDPFEALGYSRPIRREVSPTVPARRGRTTKPGAKNPHGWGPQEHVYNPITDPAAQPLHGEAARVQADINQSGVAGAQEVLAGTESAEDRAHRQSITRSPRITREVDEEEQRRQKLEEMADKPTIGAIRAQRAEEQARGVAADEVAMGHPDHIEE